MVVAELLPLLSFSAYQVFGLQAVLMVVLELTVVGQIGVGPAES